MEQDSPKIFSEECIFGPSQECPSYLKPIWSAFSIRSLSINGAKCAIIAAGATIMPYLDNIDDLTIEALTTKESKERFMSCYKFFFVKNLATTVTLRALEHQLVDTVGEENGKEYFQDCVDIAKTNPNNESKFELSKTVFDASLKRNFLNHVSIFLISALYDIIKYFKDIRSLAHLYKEKFQGSNKKEIEFYEKNQQEDVDKITSNTLKKLGMQAFICVGSIFLEALGYAIFSFTGVVPLVKLFGMAGGNVLYFV